MISKKCKYAIHALVYMGKEPEEKFLIKDISAACNIPKKFLEAILLDLKRAGILGSRQGKGGGYFMRREPSDVNLAEIVRLFDGAIAAVPCATYKFYESCDECEDEETCTVRDAFLQLRNATVELLKANTLEDLVQREHDLKKQKKTGRSAPKKTKTDKNQL
jgi:Rrf2 family protein